MRALLLLAALLLSCASAPLAPARPSTEPAPPPPPAPGEPIASSEPPAPPVAPPAPPPHDPPVPPRHTERAAPPPPPAEITGEGPCTHDADCSVQETQSCCGCARLSVLSRRHKPTRPEACGCADLGNKQALATLTGKPGPCGFMPPPASDYRAACRERICVGIHR